jgi:hypothetical protein
MKGFFLVTVEIDCYGKVSTRKQYKLSKSRSDIEDPTSGGAPAPPPRIVIPVFLGLEARSAV